MTNKQILCQKAIELENEVEFMKEAGMPYQKQQRKLQQIKGALQAIKDATESEQDKTLAEFHVKTLAEQIKKSMESA